MNVAVTACGGGVGQSIIKALSRTKYTTVGIDPDYRAAGLYMARIGVLGGRYTDSNFIDRLLSICLENNCRFLFPGLDAELEIISKNEKLFIENKIIPIISSQEVVRLSNDKWELFNFLKKNDLPHIKTFKTIEDALASGLSFPWVVKPQKDGCRSKNVSVVHSEEEFGLIKLSENLGENYIIQEYIDGDEYTCGSVSFDGRVIGTITMERALRDGDTYKAYVKRSGVIEEFLIRLLKRVKPFGPCNIQIRMKDNIPYVLEINSRCSGTTAARAVAGFNEPEITCNYLAGQKINYSIEEVSVFRYWNECVIKKEKTEELRDEGIIHGGFRIPGQRIF